MTQITAFPHILVLTLNVDILPRVGRQQASTNAGLLRIVIVSGKGAVNLNITEVKFVEYDVAETLAVLFFILDEVRVVMAKLFPGAAHGKE